MQGTIGMPYGPGYQQPSPPTPGNISSGGKSGGWQPPTQEQIQQREQTNTQDYLSRNPYDTSMGGTQDLYNQYANYASNLNNQNGPFISNLRLTPQSYQNWLSQQTPLPPAQTSLQQTSTTNPVLQGPGDLTGQIGMPAGPGYMQPAPKVVATPPATPLNPLGTIGLPYGPGYTAPTMKPVLKSPAVPVPQTPQQIRAQVGIRANPVQPRTTARPIYRPKAY
jgi:hypothetical protein